MKGLLLDLYGMGIKETVLEDGTEISNIHIIKGQYPNACDGFITAIVNGRPVKYPYGLDCQDYGTVAVTNPCLIRKYYGDMSRG